MRPVEPREIRDLRTYEHEREDFRARAMAVKAPRRVHLGPALTFLFENAETVRYQVQEMLRAEGRSSAEDVAHELATYNELLGGPGELGCTLLIEIDDAAERDRRLREWIRLPHSLYAVLPDGERVPATFDERQIGRDRLSAVQYLKFDTGGAVPVALECALPGFELRAELSPEQRAALAADLAE